MTPERLQQIRSIFEACLEQSAGARMAFVEATCVGDRELQDHVLRLLMADAQQQGVFDQPALEVVSPAVPSGLEGRLVGQYQVLRLLGHGGMGDVYLAQRADNAFHKQVALKVLRSSSASPDMLHRFDQECRILASLNHPNIARFFDGGKTADGLPYYVMEFIEGQPIDRHCDLQRLDLRSRLALFQQVCDAVNCAHRSGIVHRDLKPSNILVTPGGIVKLLDFGIAKLLQPDPGGATIWLTDSGLRPMTPEYASPEQIQEEELTRATDVYSLGVVLYEMLTGRRPYRLRSRVFHEILRVVCEEQPTLPSIAAALPPDAPGVTPSTDSDTLARLRQTTPGDLRKQLSGDLDSIVMKALRKEPWQRYGSAAQFGEDVRRHLAGSPVDARSGRYYRLWKRLNRNRGWLVLAIALMMAVSTGGIHITWPTVWIGAAALVMFAIWQVGENRELARRIAGGPVWRILRTAVFVTLPVVFFVSMIGPSHISQNITRFMAGFNHGYYGGHDVAPPIQAKDFVRFDADPRWDWALTLSWWVPVGLLLARWMCRRRWGGSLVFDASRSRNKALGAAIVVMLSLEVCVYGQWLWLSATGRPVEAFEKADLLEIPYVLLLIALWALSGRCEFRRSGLVTATSFYRWPSIESHCWTADTLLTLKLHGRHPLLPTPKIKVPQVKRPEVEVVMTRFLSEWPGGTGN